MNTILSKRMKGLWKKVLKCVGLLISLPVLYLFVYVVLSQCGQYRPMSYWENLDHFQLYSVWAPLGFYNSHPPVGSLDPKRGGTWRINMILIFDPLWTADICHVHKRQDVYMAGQFVNGKWIYTTNNAICMPY